MRELGEHFSPRASKWHSTKFVFILKFTLRIWFFKIKVLLEFLFRNYFMTCYFRMIYHLKSKEVRCQNIWQNIWNSILRAWNLKRCFQEGPVYVARSISLLKPHTRCYDLPRYPWYHIAKKKKKCRICYCFLWF